MVERLRRLREWPLAGSGGALAVRGGCVHANPDVATVVLRSRALAAFPAALREKVAAGALLV